MKIDWASSFHPDGSRRSKLPPSTMHGWLAKMRGTLLGDEKLRSKGMREMKEARDARKKTNGHHRASTGRSIFSIFSFYMGPSKKSTRQSQGNSARTVHRSHRNHRNHRNHQNHQNHQNHNRRPHPHTRGSTGAVHREPSSRYTRGQPRNRRSTR